MFRIDVISVYRGRGLFRYVRRFALPYRLAGVVSRHYGARVVSRDTSIVIEGFPRSGNTFAEVAFRMRHDEAVCVAHHLHSIGQIRYAIKRGIPCMILVRDPRDSVPSLVVRNPKVSLSDAFKDYVEFYRYVLAVRNSIFIAQFDRVIEDFDRVLLDMNAFYGTSFHANTGSRLGGQFILDELERLDRINSGGDEHKVARPSAKRKELKWEVMARVRSDRGLRKQLSRALTIYRVLRK